MIEVFARVRVDGLVVAAVGFAVPDRVAVEAAPQAVFLRPWGTDIHGLRRGSLVDAGDRRFLERVGRHMRHVDRQHARTGRYHDPATLAARRFEAGAAVGGRITITI